MEKGMQVSQAGDVYYLNFTVNFNNNVNEATKERKKLASNSDTKTNTKNVSEEDVPSKKRKIISRTMSSENFAGRDTLQELFENHKDNEKYFQMTYKPKGKVIIINNTFESDAKQNTREGSRKDVRNLSAAFALLGSKDSAVSISSCLDLPAQEMKDFLEYHAASRTRPSFIAVVIASHGSISDKRRDGGYDDLIICVDGVRVNVRDIVKIFKKDHLKEIPVLLFFQMCRGKQIGRGEDLGVRHVEPDGDEQQHDGAFNEKISRLLRDLLIDILPRGSLVGATYKNQGEEIDAGVCHGADEADEDAENYIRDMPNMLISFSTSEKYVSIRDKYEGSWFIQSICDKIKEKVRRSDAIDVLVLMNEVHLEVNGRRSYVDKFREHVIACETAESLSKKLCFFPGLS